MMPPPLTRILLVEDDADIQEVVRLVLEVLGGFTVEMCDSGVEAVRTALAFAPDLILLDVMMPGMDGPTTLRGLREVAQIAAIPVIFMTAKAQASEIAQYKEMGALNVIAKPFDPMTLPATIRAMWALHHQG
jgi:two-component system, OmpR family, response regulator